jgi:F-type H+-transporting ATPase subunit gamma
VFKLVSEHAAGAPYQVLPVGKKALERYAKVPGCVVSNAYPVAELVTVGNAFRMAEMVLNGYREGNYGQVYLVYTRFDSMLTQTACATQLLPLTVPEKGSV